MTQVNCIYKYIKSHRNLKEYNIYFLIMIDGISVVDM